MLLVRKVITTPMVLKGFGGPDIAGEILLAGSLLFCDVEGKAHASILTDYLIAKKRHPSLLFFMIAV
ncbi:MAG: hypothetical protein P8N67_03020 [Pseudomonadales bacterium]|nr:hypothetical protein [Pseudomonadales bacterium]